ncbi:MAG: cobalamin-binding protein [Cyanobacteria bacterium P01_F01_bin.150]
MPQTSFVDQPRIVSLLPSATEILHVLGLTPFVVGRSHECDYPGEIGDRPICTSARLNPNKASADIDQDVKTLLRSALGIYDIDIEQLKALQPTHIVTQDQCDVCAVTFADVETAVATLAAPRPQVISLQPSTLKEVWADIERVGHHLNMDATAVIAQLQQRVTQVQQAVADISSKRPKVATIEWIEPLMGGGNWVPELVELAGGENLFGTIGQHSPYLEWETFLDADPDVIVILPCGFDLDRTRQEMKEALAQNPRWQRLRAVQQGRLYLTDGNAYFNRPGPRLVDSLEILLEIFHSSSDGAISSKYKHIAWEQLAL